LQEAVIKYIVTVFSVIVFVILYVFQNVGVMKIKIECRKDAEAEKRLIIKNDKLRYEIERYKNMEVIERYASERGMRKITPYDFETIIIKDK
jgi:hypothetical protein